MIRTRFFAHLIPEAATTDSTAGYPGEETAPTSNQVEPATLLDEAAAELERAAEPEPDEAEASEDEPIADAETPATE